MVKCPRCEMEIHPIACNGHADKCDGQACPVARSLRYQNLYAQRARRQLWFKKQTEPLPAFIRDVRRRNDSTDQPPRQVKAAPGELRNICAFCEKPTSVSIGISASRLLTMSGRRVGSGGA